MVPYQEVRFKGTPEEVSEQWREARTHGVGGSDVAAILGLNKYRTALDVWIEKTGRAQGADLSGVEAVEWGNRLEPVVASKFADVHPELKVRNKNAMMVSKARPWAFANIDRRLSMDGEPGVLEIKTVGYRRASDWEDGVPAYYLTQVLHYLSVTGWTYAYVAALIGGQQYVEYELKAEDYAEDIEYIDGVVDDFWQSYVLKDVEPAAAADDGGGLAMLHPDGEGELLAPEAQEAVEKYEQAKERERDIKDYKDALAAEIKQLMGDHQTLDTGGFKVTWTRGERVSLDSRRLKAEAPEVYERYARTSVRDGGLRVKAAD